MNFASSQYPVFLAVVFFLYFLLRQRSRTAYIAQLAVLLLLGDLLYLLLTKDVASLWDPLGVAVFSLISDDPLPDRGFGPYVIGVLVLVAGLALGYFRQSWLRRPVGQHWLAGSWAAFLTALAFVVGMLSVDYSFEPIAGPQSLEDLTFSFQHYGHLLVLFGLGLAFGAGIHREGQSFARVLLLFVASSIFYHAWAASQKGAYVYLLALIIGTLVVDFWLAIWIERCQDKHKRRLLLIVALVANLGVLAVFKYLDFFAEVFGLGFELDLILPAGISFHTFQSLSYTIDVYRGKMPATRSVLQFSTYVIFFPQLIAGPIVRANELMPQLERLPAFDYEKASQGLFRIIVGLFKKIAIADTLGPIFVKSVFFAPHKFSGAENLFAVYGFAFVIYLDFSAYSDIAIGSAKILGYDFPENFDTPYRSRNLQEFWRRWHMTLSRWLRDYLYIPLGGSRYGPRRTYINLLLTMLIGGLWHGASWTFIIWGALHGGGLAVTRVFQRMYEQSPARAARLLRWSAAAIPVVVGIHWLFTPVISSAGNTLNIDPAWLHLILGWIYIVPGWAAASAWLSMPKGPQQSASVPTILANSFRACALLCMVGLLAYAYHHATVSTVVYASLLDIDREMTSTAFDFHWLHWGLAAGLWLVFSNLGAISRFAVSGLHKSGIADRLKTAGAAVLTFHYVCFAWIFFAAPDFERARSMIAQIVSLDTGAANISPLLFFALAIAFVSHFVAKDTYMWLRDSFTRIGTGPKLVVIVICTLLLREFRADKPIAFIYTQF